MKWVPVVRVVAVAVVGLAAVACGDDDDDDGGAATAGTSGDDRGYAAGPVRPRRARVARLNVIIVGNPQMEDISELTPELFTAETGINVNYSVLEETTLREVVTRDIGASGEQFDVVMIGMYEAPQFGANGWLVDLTPYAEADESYQLDDLIPTVRDGVVGRGQAVRVAVLRRVVVRDVPQRRARGRRTDDAREPNLGRGGGDRPRRRQRRDGRHLLAGQARLG